MISLVQDRINKVNIPFTYSTSPITATFTLQIEGSTRVYPLVKVSYCVGRFEFELEHECDNRNAFSLDVGEYEGILLEDGEEVSRFVFKIYSI